MIVYAFLYCDCIYESAFSPVSLHKTLEGAIMAMEFHKAKAKKEFDSMYKELDDEPPCEFGSMEGWLVEEMEILD